MLEERRKSKSPPLKKKIIHIKSHSGLVDDSANIFHSSRETISQISSTNLEYGLKSPEYYYKETTDIKNLKSENFRLKQKIIALEKEHELEIVRLKQEFHKIKQE